MDGSEWEWAKLNGDQLKLIVEAERTLGADYLLAFRRGGQSASRGIEPPKGGPRVARLNESQVECLQGLETQLQSIVVAYQQA